MLNPKRQRFCDEYLIDLNATQAAIRAGYSPKTAGQQAEQLLKNLDVKAYVASKSKKITEKTEISVEWVLKQLIAETQRPADETTPGARVKATELIGKYLAMFTDRVEVKDVTPTEVVEEVVATRKNPTDAAAS